ncbi:hypothetical protein V9K67_24575 [Paraflavisolibacter sp. H34]|uniref:hypothetical protein n=1 Tax=Huijunlia imazamoxiresistens TaxID=3127457 RepID=UPI0030164A09
MYIIGFIQDSQPRALINPVPCATREKLYTWIDEFLNERDFKLEAPITQESLEQALAANKPVTIPFTGYKVKLMFGPEEVIHAATDRFVHNLDGISGYFQKQ